MTRPIVCARTRAELQEAHDADRAPDPAALRHLGACPACAEFRALLEGLGSAIRRSAASPAPTPWEPDYGRIVGEGRRRRGTRRGLRLIRVLPAAAACLLAAALGTAVLFWPDPPEEASTERNVEAFVEGLFSAHGLDRPGYELTVLLAASWEGE